MYKYLLSFIRHLKEDTSPIPDRADATQQFAIQSLRGIRKRPHLRHDVIMMSKWFIVLLRMSRSI